MKTSKTAKRNNAKAKSIEIENETDEENEIEVTELEAAAAAAKYETGWAQGGLQRDHLIQTLLKLTESFGVYRSVPGEVVNGEVTYQEVFYKGTYALENVEGLRQYLNEEDSPKTRELMIRISKYNIMAKYIVPLFCMAVDDKPLAVSIFRLLLLLTKPLAADTKRTLVHPIRPRKSKETADQSKTRVEREKKDRINAYEQVSALLSFKQSLVNDEVFSVIMSHSVEPLLKQSDERTQEDKVIIECLLMLISNLIAIESSIYSPSTEVKLSQSLQNKLIVLLEGEFLGIMLLLCQTIMDKGNAPWNVILVEIIYHLFKCYDAKAIYKCLQMKKHPEIRPVQVRGALHDQLVRERLTREQNMVDRSRFSGVLVKRGGELSSKNQIMRSLTEQNRHTNVVKKALKKNNTFTVDNVKTSDPLNVYAGGARDEEKQAMLIICDFVEALLNYGFSELVYSIKENWRRNDDSIMSTEEELMYYSMCSFCLRYQRFKLQEEQHEIQAKNSGTWSPDLRNVTQCFDRMSFIRPIDAMRRVRDVLKRPDLIVMPMDLYKEMLCFLRLMLESVDPAHNDIALGALYKLYYISAEREDPLLQLLRDWKPNTYGKQHLCTLVELVHECLKLLDNAFAFFKLEAEGAGINKRKKKKDAVEDERALYIGAALRFEPQEYFRKIVNNHTLDMYVRLLELYTSNAVHINHYVFVFLQRMCSFKLENDLPPSPHNTEVSLGHMLFNVRILSVFNTILHDPVAQVQPPMEPLLRLLRTVVRRFGETVTKNPLAFVEALFLHPHPATAWQNIESVYDAVSLSRGIRATSYPSDTEGGRDKRSEDWGEEFDENDEIITTAVASKRKLSTKPKAGGSKKRRQWSLEEDAALKELYRLYAGRHSVFDSIANDEKFRSTGGNRTAGQIASRVRELNLHLTVNQSDDEEDKLSEGGETEHEGEVSMTLDAPAPAVIAVAQADDSKKAEVAFWEEPDEEDDPRWKATSSLASSTSVLAARHVTEQLAQAPVSTIKPKVMRKKKAISDEESDKEDSFVEEEPRRKTYQSVLVDSDDE